MEADLAQLKQYRRKWVGVSIVVLMGLALSGMLNVLHAPKQGGVVAMVIGGWPPVAVFLCIELVSRIPATSRLLAWLGTVPAVAVTLMAFYVSFEHQLSYIRGLGFEGSTALILPLTIDGVMMVATVKLYEVSTSVRRMRVKIADAVTAAEVDAMPKPAPAAQPIAQRPSKRGRRPGEQPNQPKRRIHPGGAPGASAPASKGTPKSAPVTAPTVEVVEIGEPAMAAETLSE